ncbi:MAG: glucose-6-phosphate isomerase [Gemmatirosa sp.]|nr:glucose-6-phosphate isomerase [Gemmatirosa sp.]
MALSIDFTNMFLPGAVTDADWEQARGRFKAARAAVNARWERGELGFIDLPHDAALLAQTTDFVAKAGDRWEDVVVLGIGGSALGPIALRTALRPHAWNSLSREERGGRPRLTVLDNVDPETIGAVLGRLDLERTLFIVTSKSGGTAETMAQYLIVRGVLDERLGDRATEHLVFVTDPAKGSLRPVATKERIEALDIPPNVGGRFSVLTPVGLLPAALIGIDVARLMEGAEDMRRRCESDELESNPAGVFALLQWLAHERHGKGIHVLMPYADPLRDFAAWFVQLWAESLGKVRKDGTHVGPTPLAALGATDQHSQVQLFMEGPADKTITFIEVAGRGALAPIPSLYADVPDLAYLGGHSLGELLDAERRATAGALATRGRPNMTMTVDAVDPWHVGALIFLLELATAYAGSLYDIDAFDQPGVELGKQFTYAILGRPGSDAARGEWDTLPKPDAKRRV